MAKPVYTKNKVLRELRALANPKVRAQMEHFGVHVEKAHGVSAPQLHRLAKRIGKNHKLADQLWATGIHEAKGLAALIGEPGKVTEAQMERWACSYDAWDVVEASCCYLFVFAAPEWKKPIQWSRREEECVKSAACWLQPYLT